MREVDTEYIVARGMVCVAAIKHTYVSLEKDTIYEKHSASLLPTLKHYQVLFPRPSVQ